jgi:hypothetical protein
MAIKPRGRAMRVILKSFMMFVSSDSMRPS